MTVRIIDGQPLFREGIRSLLSATPFSVVVHDDLSPDALTRLALGGSQDVVVADLDGPHLFPMLVRARGGMAERTVAITNAADPTRIRRALELSVRVVLHRDVDVLGLSRGIETAFHGTGVQVIARIDPTELAAVFDDATPLSSLSRREMQVLRLVALGQTSREIGERLGISSKTIETYRVRVGWKIGAQSRADFVAFALRHGLMDV